MKRVVLGVIILLMVMATAHASFFDFFSAWMDSTPEIIASYATPLKVYPGQELTVIAEVRSGDGVIVANAKFFHEQGFDDVPMVMVASQEDNDQYTYQAKWEVHDTLEDKWYETHFTFTDADGDVVDDKVDWQDPSVSHRAEEIQPGNFSPGNFSFNGNLDITGTSNLANWSSQILDENGTAKMGSVRFQWGKISAGGEGTFTITFPVTFSSIFNLQCVTENGPTFNTAENTWCQVISLSTSSASVGIQYSNTQTNNADGIYWFAIGT